MSANAMHILFRFFVYGIFCSFSEIIHTAFDFGGAKYGHEYPRFLGRLCHVIKLGRLEGYTTLWAFLAYGAAMTFGFESVHNAIRTWPLFLREAIYVPSFYFGEFIFVIAFIGIFKRRPWTYNSSWLAPKGLVHFGYAPLWMILLYLLERLHNFMIFNITF